LQWKLNMQLIRDSLWTWLCSQDMRGYAVLGACRQEITTLGQHAYMHEIPDDANKNQQNIVCLDDESIEVSILRFTIRILRFDTIQMDKDTNLYFVSLERRILRIVSVSFCISIRYVSQRYNNFKIHIFFFYFTSSVQLHASY